MRYHIITYGCQMNKSDSERIASVLENVGYQPASEESKADLIVVNMCSVRQSAVDRVYGLLPKFKKLKTMPRTETKFLVRGKNSKLKTILTGCILRKDRQRLVQQFDLILDIKDLSNWSRIIKSNALFCHGKITRHNYFDIKPSCSNNFSAFIPISNGCNNFCTFCVVPNVRGPLICRNHKEILEEVKNVVKKGLNPIRNAISNGAREIWLLGQNVNDYQSPTDSSINFAKLLKMINDIPENFWIRFTSPHPADFSDELIGAMAECEKVTEYLNLPVQSGDDEILKIMNRPYTIRQYKNLVKKIRAAFKKYRKDLEKEVALSTDIIVGFPGETKNQFENTVKLFKEIKFDMAYIAKYSPRPGTAAAKMKDTIPYQEKERRYKILTEILKETALGKNKKYLKKEVEILVDDKKNGFLIGKTRTYKTVKFKSQKNLVGQFVKVKIVEALSWGLKGALA